MNEKKTIIVATIKEVHASSFKKLALRFPEKELFLISRKEDLTVEKLNRMKPDIVFFPHWSWIIEREIFEKFECVIFHTADLPYGRGGSPLQNQIIRKIYNSRVCAVRANATVDGGDIYARRDIFLGLGSMDEILQVVSNIIFEELIPDIIADKFALEKQ